MTYKQLTIAAFAMIMTVTLTMQPVFAQQATGTMDIQARTCGLDLVGGNTLDYGPLFDGDTFYDDITPINFLKFNNTGNTNSNVFISGEDWVNATDVKTMNANQTYFTQFGGFGSDDSYSNLIDSGLLRVQTTEFQFTVLNSAVTQDWFFGSKVSLDDSAFTGTMTQTTTFTTECVIP